MIVYINLLLSHTYAPTGLIESFTPAFNYSTPDLLDVIWSSVNVMCSISIQEYGEIILACYLDLVTQGYTFEMPMPGVRCPRCAARGIEQWVLPGKHCPRCNQPC